MNFVTIYYDQLTDLFAIIDSKSNSVLDFDIATKVKYAEIFGHKSSDVLKTSDICVAPNQQQVGKESKELPVYQEKLILSYDATLAILEEKYGSNSVAVENGKFYIQDWQALKKIEHAVCFQINPGNYNFSQEQAREINYDKVGLVIYVQKGKTLLSLNFVRVYQNNIKNFCENRSLSSRNDESTFNTQTFSTLYLTPF